MRRPGVVRVLCEGSIDLWAGGIPLTVLRQRHSVMRGEPPVVAVARREPVQQRQQHALLPGPAGTADQAVGECGGAEHHGVARPGVQMRIHCGKCGFAVAPHKQVEICDMACFPLRQTGDDGFGRRDRGARRRRFAAFEQHMRPRGMGERKTGIRGDGAIEGFERAGVHGQLRLAALRVGVPRGGRGGGQRKLVAVRQHAWIPAAEFAVNDTIRRAAGGRGALRRRHGSRCRERVALADLVVLV